jgi:hypothetical protein
MDKNINEKLMIAVGRARIETIQAGVVPSPPRAKAYPGNQLFVNCLYHAAILERESESILTLARADVVSVLRALIAERALKGIVSVTVTLLAQDKHYTVNDDVPPWRVYRYSILSSAMGKSPKIIDEKFLLSNQLFLQGSNLDGVAQLLASEPRRATQLKTELLG